MLPLLGFYGLSLMINYVEINQGKPLDSMIAVLEVRRLQFIVSNLYLVQRLVEFSEVSLSNAYQDCTVAQDV